MCGSVFLYMYVGLFGHVKCKAGMLTHLNGLISLIFIALGIHNFGARIFTRSQK